MNGFETAELIHRHPRFEQTPIIFVTGVHVTDMDQLRGYQMGAVDYVYVPVVPEILRGKVQVLAQFHQQRRELQRLNRSLAAANAELARAHDDLRIEKTRELEHANQVLTTEIGERERVQQALHDAARRKDEFLAILAHELRNPLSAIHNGVQALRAPSVTDPRSLWVSDLLDRQVAHLTRLIDDLLDVSRITSGRIQLKKEPVDLSLIIARAIETSRPHVEKRKHRLSLKTPDEAIYVEGDSVRLVQMVDNLITNAAKYTDEGGSISVTLETEPSGDAPEQAVIQVRDNGLGIPGHMLNQVFDLFAQAYPRINRTQGGLGIGLSLVRGLAGLHGGAVEASSAGVGQGSEFTIRLPRCPAPRGVTPAVDQALPPDTCLDVLVVDDNIDSAMGLAVCLESRGHGIRVTYSGEDGLRAAFDHAPDVVLLDIGLPGIDGYEVAKQLRAGAATCRALVVAMTGFGGESVRKQALDAGFDHYLVKPVNHDALVGLLAQYAGSEQRNDAADTPRLKPLGALDEHRT